MAYVYRPQVTTVATGFGGYLGNKGARFVHVGAQLAHLANRLTSAVKPNPFTAGPARTAKCQPLIDFCRTGAVAARLRVYDSTLAIVAAHLTAGDVEGDELKRNADVAEVLRRAAFATAPDGGGAVPMTSPMAALVSECLPPVAAPAAAAARLCRPLPQAHALASCLPEDPPHGRPWCDLAADPRCLAGHANPQARLWARGTGPPAPPP